MRRYISVPGFVGADRFECVRRRNRRLRDPIRASVRRRRYSQSRLGPTRSRATFPRWVSGLPTGLSAANNGASRPPWREPARPASPGSERQVGAPLIAGPGRGSRPRSPWRTVLQHPPPTISRGQQDVEGLSGVVTRMCGGRLRSIAARSTLAGVSPVRTRTRTSGRNRDPARPDLHSMESVEVLLDVVAEGLER